MKALKLEHWVMFTYENVNTSHINPELCTYFSGWEMSYLTVKIGAVGGNNLKICGRMRREGITAETVYIKCKRGVRGRRVLITTREKTLTLCEVAIYGKQS